MVDRRDSDSSAEDSLEHRVYCESNNRTDLKDLTFIGYSYDLSQQEIMPISKFGMSKRSIRKLVDHNYKILYDNKSLFVSINVSCALIKKVETLPETSRLKSRIPYFDKTLQN